MPQIPYYPVQEVLPQGQIGPQRIESGPADFGAQAGNALQQDSGELWQQAQVKQQLANETQVNDVINNKFFPAFQNTYQKYYSLQGKDAVDQLPAYQQQMRDLVQQYRQDLPNPMQQRAFDQETQKRLQYEFGGMGRYAEQQNKVYQAQTMEGTIDRTISSAADKYNDPLLLKGGLISIANSWAKFGMQTGMSPETVDAQQHKSWDKLYATVVERQALDPSLGPAVANKTFQEGVAGGFISGEMQLKIQSELHARLQTADASNFVTGLLGKGPPVNVGPGTSTAPAGWKVPAGSSLDREVQNLTTAIAQRESGNKADSPNADAGGLPGRYQFQAGTWQTMSSAYNLAVNKANGPLKNTDENEQAVAKWQIGQWMGQGYSPAQIASMWNSSHPDWNGRVGAKYNVPDYVGAVVGNYQRLAGSAASGMVADASGQTVPVADTGDNNSLQPAQPPPGGWTKESLEAQMPQWEREIADRYPDNWMAQNQATTILRAKVNQITQGLQQQAQADQLILHQAVADTKGHMNLDDSLKDQTVLGAYTRMMKTNADQCIWFNEQMAQKGRRLATPEAKPTQEQMNQYYQWVGEASLDPDKFANEKITNLGLPDSFASKLMDLQLRVRQGLRVQEAKNSTLDAALKAAQFPLKIAGIDATKTPQQYKAFYGRLNEWLANFEANNKRAPKNTELSDGIDSLLQQVPVPGTLYGTNTRYGFQLSPQEEQSAHMPPGLIPAATAAFQKKYGRMPLPDELDSLYFTTRFHPGDAVMQNALDAQIQANTKALQHAQDVNAAAQGVTRPLPDRTEIGGPMPAAPPILTGKNSKKRNDEGKI